MHLELTWNDEKLPLDLADGRFSAGGGDADALHLPGLVPGLLTLDVRGDRLTVTAARTLRIGEALFPAGVARLVMPGEAVLLTDGVTLSRPGQAREAVNTACLARQLLSDDVDPLNTRAGTLTSLTGPHAGTSWVLPADVVLVGRADDVHVQVPDRAVSRRHLKLKRVGSSFVVEDLGGLNGAFVNGVKLTRPRRLSTGDVIELGQTVLRYDAPLDAPEERTVIVAAVEPKPAPAPEPPVVAEHEAAAAPEAAEAPVSPALANEETLPLPSAGSARAAALLIALSAVIGLGGVVAVLVALH